MKKQVKAEGLALNTIAIAAIVLVVLLVVLVIFKGGIGNIWPSISGANNCKEIPPAYDYGCKPASDLCTSGQLVYGLGCETKNIDPATKQSTKPYCCVQNKNE